MAKCDFRHVKYMAFYIKNRGDLVHKDFKSFVAIIKIRITIQLADWCPIGFKCGINYKTSTFFSLVNDLAKVMRAIYMSLNSTAIAELFSLIDKKVLY